MNIVSRCISFLLLGSLSAPGLAWQPSAVEDLGQRQYLSPKEAAQFEGENVIFLDVRSTAAFVVGAMRRQGYTVVPVVGGGYRELIANGLPKD